MGKEVSANFVKIMKFEENFIVLGKKNALCSKFFQ